MVNDTAVSKYVIRLTMEEKLIGLKPFLHNTLGNIILALIQELRDVKIESDKAVLILFNMSKEETVQLQVGGASLGLNTYIQEMIHKTITGFLLTLKDMPPKFEDMLCAKILIEFRFR